MRTIFLTLSIILPLIGPVIYIFEILFKGVKPNRVTWFVWFVISLITTVSLFAQDSKTSVWISTVMLLQAGLVFVLSLIYGDAKWERVDIVALVLASLGIIGWIVTKEPLVALAFSILADFAGLLPTLFKAYKKPHEESYIFFLIDVFASVFNLLATGTLRSEDAIYAGYLLVANLLVVVVIVGRRFDKTPRDKVL